MSNERSEHVHELILLENLGYAFSVYADEYLFFLGDGGRKHITLQQMSLQFFLEQGKCACLFDLKWYFGPNSWTQTLKCILGSICTDSDPVKVQIGHIPSIMVMGGSSHITIENRREQVVGKLINEFSLFTHEQAIKGKNI